MLGDDLRQAIHDAGLNANQIVRRAGDLGLGHLDHKSVQRFIKKATPGITFHTAELIAEVLDLAIAKKGATMMREPGEVEAEIERRAIARAIQWITEGFDACLRDRVKRGFEPKDYDSDPRHIKEGL